MKRILTIFALFASTQAYCSIIFSAGYSIAGLTTNALSDQKGTAAGKEMILKLGLMMDKTVEIGAYNSNGSYSTKVTHDVKTSDLVYEKQSFGVYATYYRKKIYLEFGYGKSAIKESLDGDLTSSEINVINNVYDIHKDTLNGDEGKLLIGLKAFSFGDFVTTIYAQKVIQFSSTHQVNQIGLEIKAKI